LLFNYQFNLLRIYIPNKLCNIESSFRDITKEKLIVEILRLRLYRMQEFLICIRLRDFNKLPGNKD